MYSITEIRLLIAIKILIWAAYIAPNYGEGAYLQHDLGDLFNKGFERTKKYQQLQNEL